MITMTSKEAATAVALLKQAVSKQRDASQALTNIIASSMEALVILDPGAALQVMEQLSAQVTEEALRANVTANEAIVNEFVEDNSDNTEH